MAKKKSLLSKLPVKTSALTKAIGAAATDSAQQLVIRLVVDKQCCEQLRNLIRTTFVPKKGAVQVDVLSVADALGHSKQVASFCTLFLGHSKESIEQVLVAELKAGQQTLLICDDANALLEADKAWPSLVDYSDVIFFSEGSGQLLLGDVAKWFIRKFPKQREVLARSWEFLHKEATDNIITTSALQNFAIGAIPFLPGADMPLITGNQVRMALDLAQTNNLEVSNARLKELAAILVLALLSRGLSRKLVAVMPFAKWLARGVVGAGSTLVSGFALQAYYAAQKGKAGKQVDDEADTIDA